MQLSLNSDESFFFEGNCETAVFFITLACNEMKFIFQFLERKKKQMLLLTQIKNAERKKNIK